MKKLLFLLLISVFNLYANLPIHEFTLKNGLKIIMIEKTSVPIIELSIWFNCGSKCDSLTKSGAAHFLEHLAFLNHKKEFSNYLEEIGSNKNAFTSITTICFHETFPKEYLEQILQFESNRIRNLEIEPSVFENEKKSILEERGMSIDGDISGQYHESIMANLFNRQIGGVSIIGWNHEINNLTIQDLKDFYKNWIIPNNATIIVVGDFNKDHTLQLITKYFGSIPASPTPKLFYAEHQNLHPKTLTIKSSKAGAYHSIQYVYKVPFSSVTNLRKSLALILALEILEQPTFFIKGILTKIDKTSGSIDFSLRDLSYQFNTLFVSFSSNLIDNTDKFELYWKYVRKKILSNGVSETDLKKIKKKKLIQLAFKLEDIENISEYFGWHLINGMSLKNILSIDQTVQSITLEECNAVLKEVFSSSPIYTIKTVPQGYDRDQ